MVGFVEELNEVLNGVVMQVDKMIRGVEETFEEDLPNDCEWRNAEDDSHNC